jgi:hypothetical protein
MDDEARSRRRSWPVRVFRLGAEPGDDLSSSTTPETRLGMMWELALEAYTLSGLSVPGYPRHQTPVSRRPAASRRRP